MYDEQIEIHQLISNNKEKYMMVQSTVQTQETKTDKTTATKQSKTP